MGSMVISSTDFTFPENTSTFSDCDHHWAGMTSPFGGPRVESYLFSSLWEWSFSGRFADPNCDKALFHHFLESVEGKRYAHEARTKKPTKNSWKWWFFKSDFFSSLRGPNFQGRGTPINSPFKDTLFMKVWSPKTVGNTRSFDKLLENTHEWIGILYLVGKFSKLKQILGITHYLTVTYDFAKS